MPLIQSPMDLYKAMRGKRGKIVSNFVFPWSPGHMIGEVDNFLRMRHLGEIDPDCFYLLPWLKHDITQTMAELYGGHFTPETRSQVAVNSQIFAFARELARTDPAMAVDPSISHCRFAWEKRGDYRLMPFQNAMHFALNNREVIKSETEWRRRRFDSMDYRPFIEAAPPIEGGLAELLGTFDKLALVHRRHDSANVGRSTPPEQYFPSLAWLRDNGFRIVFVSREPFPEDFARFGVVNYSQSAVASFRNDLALFKRADLALVSGAGIGSLAQVMDTPLVWTNSWCLNLPFSSTAAVWLPCRLRSKATGQFLTFTEQAERFANVPEMWEVEPDQYSSPHYGNPWSSINSQEFLEIVPPSGEEMRDAVAEAVALSIRREPRTPLQELFNYIDRPLTYLEGRIARSFIEKYADGLLPMTSRLPRADR